MSPTQLRNTLNISKRHRYVYIDNPKAGSSSLKSALVALELGVSVDSLHHRQFHSASQSPFARLDDFVTADPIRSLVSDGYFFFTMVRDPLTRLVSAYRSKIEKNTKHKAQILSRMGLDPADLTQPVSFADFVRVTAELSDLESDPHWRSQTSQTLFERLPIDFTGRFEDFAEAYRTIFERIGGQTDELRSPPKRNASGEKQRQPEFFDEELRATAVRRYEADFVNFGYRRG